jgi:putative methyltransferase (TIGR04325 family)
MRLSSLIPPVLNQVLQSKPREFPDYASALAACGQAYEARELVEIVYAKTQRYRDSSPALTAAEQRLMLAIAMANPRTVVDFGGACGAHYFLARRVFGERFHWRVVETEAMVMRAKDLRDSRLDFFTSLSDAVSGLGEVDLVFSSGTIQYVPAPIATLQGLVSVGAAHLFLTRLAVNDGPPTVHVQRSRLSANGPGPMPAGMRDKLQCYPVTQPSAEKIAQEIASGYSSSLEFDEGDGMRGYYARRRV